jgi:hypothetical protein
LDIKECEMKSTTSTRRIRGEKNQTKKNRIDVKEAAKAAAEYFVELYPDTQYSDLMLEEVELSEDEKHWLITLSYASEPPPPPPSGLDKLFSKLSSRKYKLFKIDAATGKAESMKIRSLY